MTAKEMYGKMKKGTVTKKEVYKFIDSEMSKVPKNKRQIIMTLRELEHKLNKGTLTKKEVDQFFKDARRKAKKGIKFFQNLIFDSREN